MCRPSPPRTADRWLE
ncbi:hypothetical protein KZP12_07430 [Bifidobacterium pseudocatenulatum]|nr:hypothetical protein [Bifidobacterium pseudocatenulatum]MCB4900276.1 hypothetical protein [Bifidobacterium pseudocatenulatum]